MIDEKNQLEFVDTLCEDPKGVGFAADALLQEKGIVKYNFNRQIETVW